MATSALGSLDLTLLLGLLRLETNDDRWGELMTPAVSLVEDLLLAGIYPVGNLVRLNTGEIAVVLKVNALDPHRPQVRVLFGRKGTRLESPYDCNLWEN